MGVTQEKKDIKNISNITLENLRNNIPDRLYEQNIYVCGNYNNYFFKNIIKELKFPIKPNIKYYETMAKHKDLKDWHFFFAPKVNNFNEMLENTKKFLEDHYSYRDFDDFNEGSKTLIWKNTILYFIDENKNTFLDYFIKNHNQFSLPLFIIVGIEAEINNLKDDIYKSIKGLNSGRIIDQNKFKFCHFTEDIENNLINLNSNLITCSAFFNELGDEFKYPFQLQNEKLFDNITKDINKNCATLNILICGRCGVGKSAFINGILHSSICKSFKGGECTHRINKYFHRKLPIIFYDTRGISTKNKMNDIINFIEINNESQIIQSKIHAVFYLFNSIGIRFLFDFESEMFEYILKKLKLPLYLLETRSESKEDFEGIKSYIIEKYSLVIKNIEESIDSQYRKENIGKNIFCINIVGNQYSETDKLFEKMFQDFKKNIILEEIDKNNLESITKNNYLLSNLVKPKDIIPQPVKLCQHIYLIYKLLSRSIKAEEKGATFLSCQLLRRINEIFGKKFLSLDECKEMITSTNFDLDKKDNNTKKEYKYWFKGYFEFKTPAEEEISYLSEKYIKLYREELMDSEAKCLKFINKLKNSFNEAINGLHALSIEFKNDF